MSTHRKNENSIMSNQLNLFDLTLGHHIGIHSNILLVTQMVRYLLYNKLTIVGFFSLLKKEVSK